MANLSNPISRALKSDQSYNTSALSGLALSTDNHAYSPLGQKMLSLFKGTAWIGIGWDKIEKEFGKETKARLYAAYKGEGEGMCERLFGSKWKGKVIQILAGEILKTAPQAAVPTLSKPVVTIPGPRLDNEVVDTSTLTSVLNEYHSPRNGEAIRGDIERRRLGGRDAPSPTVSPRSDSSLSSSGASTPSNSGSLPTTPRVADVDSRPPAIVPAADDFQPPAMDQPEPFTGLSSVPEDAPFPASYPGITSATAAPTSPAAAPKAPRVRKPLRRVIDLGPNPY